MNIQTSQGQKTPEEALDLFQRQDISVRQLLSIYRQLFEHAPALAAEATRFVINNPAGYGDKIIKIAEEHAAGRLTGVIRITSVEQVLQILNSASLRPTFDVIFRANEINEVLRLVNIGYISFDDRSALKDLIHCVEPLTPRYAITVEVMHEHEKEQLARELYYATHSMEFRHDWSERCRDPSRFRVSA